MLPSPTDHHIRILFYVSRTFYANEETILSNKAERGSSCHSSIKKQNRKVKFMQMTLTTEKPETDGVVDQQ